MGVFKSSVKFESVAQEAVHANVCDPDNGNNDRYRCLHGEYQSEQNKRHHVRVSKVVHERTHHRVFKVPDHKKVREQEQYSKEPPACTKYVIDPHGRDQQHKCFCLQYARYATHAVIVASHLLRRELRRTVFAPYPLSFPEAKWIQGLLVGLSLSNPAAKLTTELRPSQ